MVQKSKWIDGLSPDDRLSKAAAHTLDARLKLVWYYLASAAKGQAGDAESIHQLRVSTRRAKAALHSYRAVLPEERGHWMDKQLKRIRKAAGDARDYDVLIARLTPRAAQGGPDWSVLLDQLQERRRGAQQPIKKIHRRLKDRNFKQRVDALVKRVDWVSNGADEPTFGQAARLGMREAVDLFFSAAAGPQDDIAALHEFRIRGKQLRYAMEVFHDAFAEAFRTELYPQVEQFQEKLGAVIDHASAELRFGEWLDRHSDDALTGPLGQLFTEECAAVEHSRRQFFEWWTAERHDEFSERFDDVLGAAVAESVV